MDTPAQKILRLLKSTPDALSGEQIAQELGVTRTAVWKIIDSLRKQGLVIEGVQNRGYRLLCETLRLSEDAIRSGLTRDWHGDVFVRCYETITSTNTFAKVAAAESKLPCLIASNGQTSGRGRRGNFFHSPEGLGLYFSIAFHWGRDESPTLVTTMAAVALCRVLQRELGIHADIKWVNDIFLNGKKIGGILTEATSVLDTGQAESIIIGIGLNLERPVRGYPPELADIAGAVSDGICLAQSCLSGSGLITDYADDSAEREYTYRTSGDSPSVCGQEIVHRKVLNGPRRYFGSVFAEDERGGISFNRNALITMIANELYYIIQGLPKRDYLDEYRERCFVLGKEVLLDDGRVVTPTAISDEGALVYRKGGRDVELTAGEVRLLRI